MKALRQAYRIAVIKNTRPGSGKPIVDGNWDKLTIIWKGSPAAATIPHAISSSTANATLVRADDDSADSHCDDLRSTGETQHATALSCPPRKVSNKRNKLEKKLPAHERDRVFIDMVKKDQEAKEKLMRSLKEDNESISQVIGGVASSMTAIDDELGSGLAMVAMTLAGRSSQQPSQPSFMPWLIFVM